MAIFSSKFKRLIIVGLFCLVGYIDAKKGTDAKFSKKIDKKDQRCQKIYGKKIYIFDAIAQQDNTAVTVWSKVHRNSSIRNEYQQTPLMIAVKTGNSKIIDCLLKYESQTINAIDDYGRTALDYVVELYFDNNVENKLFEIKKKICKKLISKKAKTSDRKHSESVRNIMYPLEMKNFRECGVFVSKGLCNIDTVLQISDTDQYNASYVLKTEELNKEITIRDSMKKE